MFNREAITDALRFWEVGRVPYNLVLVIVTMVVLWPSNWSESSSSFVPLLLAIGPAILALALIANLLYCAAYPVDLFVQGSDFRESWKTLHYVLWIVGTLSASVFAFWLLGGAHKFDGFSHG